ncbi:MAG: HAD family phosphatase [Erysipelotrichaceae bacterium]|nr:HAD family phosphatase [Erysipelotrichaceae bacterium]
MDKKYAILDMDGTLVDSMPYWNRLGLDYLRGKGVTESEESIHKETDGLTLSEAVRIYADRYGFDAASAQEEMDEMMKSHYRNDIPLKPGVPALLNELKNSGVRLCVASASSALLISICLHRLNIRNSFEFILSCEDLNTRKKDPDIYLEAVRRFGSSPQETAVYEDSHIAVQTAKKAGFYTVGIYSADEREYMDQIIKTADEFLNLDK